LGVRHRQGRLVQLYYICPVQGTIVGVDTTNNSKEDESMDESDQEEHLDNQASQMNRFTATVKQESLTGSTDIAIEHSE
jgi:hypothetical protein